MVTIEDHLAEFTTALNQGNLIDCSKNEWCCAKWYKEAYTELFRLEDISMQKVGKAFNRYLDTVERQSVIFSATNDLKEQQKQQYAEILKAAKAVKKRLYASQSRGNKQILCDLKRRTLSLKYRIGAEYGGFEQLENAQIDMTLKQNLQNEFLMWKKEQKTYAEKQITAEEEKTLFNLCRYHKFVQFALTSPQVKDEIFKRLLRDHYGVEEFIEFVSVYKRMEECLLVGWIGRFGKNLFSIEMENTDKGQRKVVKMLMDGNKVDLLDETKTVIFDGHLEKNIKAVLEVFKAKNEQPGEFAIFGEKGVKKFNVHLHDKYNPETKIYEPINLFKPNTPWWEEYPIFEKISHDELLRRYPKVVNEETKEWEDAALCMKPGKWLVVEKAAAQSQGLDLDGSHGYVDIYIPTPEGDYILHSFGKFAGSFPKGFFGRLKFIVGTFISKISYSDENHCYFRRQQGSIPYGLLDQTGKKIMEEIRKDIISAREGNLVFQFPWENCSQWVYKKLKPILGKKKKGGLIENNYKMPILDTHPSNPLLKHLVKGVNKLPKKSRAVATFMVLFGFGSFRKKTIMENGARTIKSVAKSGFRKKQNVYIPGLLLHRIREGAVHGFLTVGPFQ